MEPQQQPGGQLPPQNVEPQPPSPAPVPPAPGTPGHNPYDFILNPEKPQKKPTVPLAGAGNSMMQRIAIAGGGLVILIIVAVVGMSLLTSGSKEKTASLLSIAQYQTELVRVATDASTKATSISAQNLAQDIQASVLSDNNELLAYMKNNGQKVDPKQLTLKRSKSTDTTLTTAKENNTYDIAFKEIIQSDLGSYMTALKKAYDANPGPKGKTLLSEQYDSAELLLKISKQ